MSDEGTTTADSAEMPASLGSLGSTAERVQRLKEHTDSSQSETASDSIGALDAAARLQRAKQRTDSSLGPTSTSGLGAAERVQRIKESTGTGPSRTVSGPRLGNQPSRGASGALQRSAEGGAQTGAAGETQVPEGVRDVISSPGRSLDTSIQRAVEDRMGDSLGDVRIHTGPKAAQACEQINARAFTVGNHVAFNSGEYDPSSPEGQHVLAHELAHVRQQTGGAVSMLPQENLGLEIDPDPQLEREAEETAQRVMEGGNIGIQRMANTEVHVQRVPKNAMFSALAVFELENQNGSVGDFQQDQNDARISHLRGAIEQFNEQSTDFERLRNEHAAHDLLEEEIEARGGTVTDDGRISGPKEVTDEFIDHEEAKEILEKDLPSKSELKDQKKRIEESLSEELEQVALTENQRDKLDVGVETGLLGTLTEKSAFSLLKSISPIFGKGGQLTWNVVKENWGKIDGDIVERAIKLREELLDEVVKDWTPESNEDPTGARPN